MQGLYVLPNRPRWLAATGGRLHHQQLPALGGTPPSPACQGRDDESTVKALFPPQKARRRPKGPCPHLPRLSSLCSREKRG